MSGLSQQLGRFLKRNVAWVVLGTLVLSEAGIVQWLRLASGRPALGPAGFAGVALALIALNAALVFFLRRSARRGLAGWVMSRVVMMASLGALFTGPLLLAAFALVGLPALVVERLVGPPQAGHALLVAGGGVAVALGFGSILWGFLVGQRRVQVERIDLPLRDLPPELGAVRIAQITDLHIGPQLRAPRLARFVERINELDADLIAITGDIFDFDPAFIEEGCRELARLEARYGVFAVLGNHDVYTGAAAVAEGMQRFTSIRLLRDEWARVEIRGLPLYLLGIDDPGRNFAGRQLESAALERLTREVPGDAPRVLLVHRPSYFDQAARLGVPVSLAGHTHGGQVSLPRPAHQHNLSRLMTQWTRGLFQQGESLLYVSRGLGVAGPPIRLNCPREISLLQLVPR